MSARVIEIAAKALIDDNIDHMQVVKANRRFHPADYAPIPPGGRRPFTNEELDALNEHLGENAEIFITNINDIKGYPTAIRLNWYNAVISAFPPATRGNDNGDPVVYPDRQLCCQITRELLAMCTRLC